MQHLNQLNMGEIIFLACIGVVWLGFIVYFFVMQARINRNFRRMDQGLRDFDQKLLQECLKSMTEKK